MKKLIAIILALAAMLTLMSACEAKETEPSKPTINPALIEVFGEEKIKAEEETIHKIMTELENCYKEHQEKKDIYTFVKNASSIFDSYDGYLKEIRNEIVALLEAEKEKDPVDKEKMLKLGTLQAQAVSYLSGSHPLYLTEVELGFRTPTAEEAAEAEKGMIESINNLAEFFYGKPIIE